MGAQRVKSHELTWDDIDAMRAEEAQERIANPDEVHDIGTTAIQLAEQEIEYGES